MSEPTVPSATGASETRLTADSAQQLDMLFRLHHQDVLRVARHHLHNRSAAEDIAAGVWVRAAQAFADGIQVRCPRAWLTTVTKNLARDYYRVKTTGEVPTDWSSGGPDLILPPVASAEKQWFARTEENDVFRRLWALPERQRNAVVLRAHGARHQDIGRTLCVAKQSVRILLDEAVATLRADLAVAS